MSSVLENFEKWKDFLGNRVEQAQKMGLDQGTINNLAVEIGNFLTEKVDPKNEQERLLKQMWEVGTEEERKGIANVLVKLVH